MRNLRLVRWLVVPAGILLGALTAANAEVNDDVRQACTPDAMRLCSEFIPDAGKVKTCMLSKRSQLSEACRTAMRHNPLPAAEHGRRTSHGHHATRHYRHHKH